MTVVRVKGVKRYCAKGRWYAYHRKTGIRLNSEFGSGEFFAELAALERKLKTQAALPETLGLLFTSYRASPAYFDLAPATRQGYARIMNLLRALNDMPLVELRRSSSPGCEIALLSNVAGDKPTTSWLWFRWRVNTAKNTA